MKNQLFYKIFICISLIIPLKTIGQDFGNITQDVDTIIGGSLGSVYLINPDAVPIAAGSGSSSSLIFAAAVKYGTGKAMAIGHEGALVDGGIKYDQLTFLVNSIRWLNSSKKTILIKNGWANEYNMTILISRLELEGYTISSTSNKITASALANMGIVIFGNDWNNMQPYSEVEINAIDEYTKNGGGVLVAGLGWSYSNSMDTYSMNNIADIFGLRFGKDVFGDTPYIRGLL